MRNLIHFSGFIFLFAWLLASGFADKEGDAQSFTGSQWVSFNSNGKLIYKALERGDRIMDFSSAGYMGGGVKLPEVPVKLTLSAEGIDDASMVQAAIDKVSEMPLVNGFRGAVLLKAGTFNCDHPLNIYDSGVVLLGSGSAENGTIVNLTGEPHTAISIKGSAIIKEEGKPMKITDAYVPSGITTFGVDDGASFKSGDVIRISRPVTELWVHFMGMDTLVRDGKKQTWITGETLTERTITKIEKNKITVDIPLTDSFDAKYLGTNGATVVKIKTTGEISRIGIENLRIVSPPKVVTITDRSNKAVTINSAADVWLKNIEVVNTINSISINAERVTLEKVNIEHTVATEGAAKPADFAAGGKQILFSRCTVQGNNLFFFATGARVSGPIVLLNCVFKGIGWIQPHQRWSTGLLVDGCQVPDGGIDFMNRGEMGSGHGWTIGWAVAWNCTAKRFINQTPPGTANWMIGCIGEREKGAVPFSKFPLLPEGIYDAHGTAVFPSSLYLAQLSERLGSGALANIGY